MAIEISIGTIARKMIEKGFALTEGAMGGWTNTLMDVLEEEYGLEDKVKHEIHQIKKYGL